MYVLTTCRNRQAAKVAPSWVQDKQLKKLGAKRMLGANFRPPTLTHQVWITFCYDKGVKGVGDHESRGEGNHTRDYMARLHDIIPAQQDSFKGSAFLKDNVMKNFGEKTAKSM